MLGVNDRVRIQYGIFQSGGRRRMRPGGATSPSCSRAFARYASLPMQGDAAKQERKELRCRESWEMSTGPSRHRT
jgi:hypothetical protein